MCQLQPQYREENLPCQAMYHEDEVTGTYLMFERELTQSERLKVREMVGGQSHWADNQTLCIIRLETD